MSKAFLRESDQDAAHDPILAPAPSLAPGTKNYMTPGGARRLRAEVAHLRSDSRPPLAAHITDTDAKRELQRVDQRIRRLEASLQSAEIIEPSAGDPETVEFGTTVTVRDADGVSDRYRIVGVDEVDAERGWISHQSPLARALLRARPGQHVTFTTPRGPAELEVLTVSNEQESEEN